MKIIYSLIFAISFSYVFGQQQQLGNVYSGNNINLPLQAIQTNVMTNVSNLDVNDNNADSNPVQQQYANYVDNIKNTEQQIQQTGNKEKQSNEIVSNGRGVDLSFGFTSRSTSSSKKTNRHTFQKKLKKFNRNFYGKLASHKKSKHLVDVCFNWSK